MLSLITKISLIALWTIMAGITLVSALPGGGLDLAAAAEINLETRSGYIGTCYVSSRGPYQSRPDYADAAVALSPPHYQDTNKCDEGSASYPLDVS